MTFQGQKQKEQWSQNLSEQNIHLLNEKETSLIKQIIIKQKPEQRNKT